MTVATEYTHANLCAYLGSAALPAGWRVHAPSTGSVGISSYPAAHADPAMHAKELSHLATFLCGIPVAEAEDQYNGHCETCAVYFTCEVVRLLTSEAFPPAEVLEHAYATLRKKLSALPWEGCVAEVFAAEQRAREEGRQGQAKQKGRTAAMWEPLLTQDVLAGVCAAGLGGEGASGGGGAAGASAIPTALGTVAASALDFLAGSPGLPARIASACSAAEASARPIVMPLYVLNCELFWGEFVVQYPAILLG